MNDPHKHMGDGISQYEYLESLLPRLGGQARRLLDNFIDKWSWRKDDNPFNLEATAREADRALWRTFYMEKAVHNLRRVQVAKSAPAPLRPDQLEDPIDDPMELEEFLTIIMTAFQSASSAFLEDLKTFRPVPRETLIKMTSRFDEMAEPLLSAGLMTTRWLALNLRTHIPAHIKKSTLGAMMKREDMRRFKRGLPLVDKDELLSLAQDSKTFLLEFEAEQRAAGLTPDARMEDRRPAYPQPKNAQRPMEERLNQGTRDLKERLGPQNALGTRECNFCKKLEHIARNCPDAPRAAPPPPPTRPTANRNDGLAAHKIDGSVCSACKEPGVS